MKDLLTWPHSTMTCTAASGAAGFGSWYGLYVIPYVGVRDLFLRIGSCMQEQQPGPVNWADNNPSPAPGVVRMWAWEVCHFLPLSDGAVSRLILILTGFCTRGGSSQLLQVEGGASE